MSLILPFPRLRFRLRNGFWCEHVRWWPGDFGRPDGWRMVDMGRRQVRYCAGCDWAEFR